MSETFLKGKGDRKSHNVQTILSKPPLMAGEFEMSKVLCLPELDFDLAGEKWSPGTESEGGVTRSEWTLSPPPEAELETVLPVLVAKAGNSGSAWARLRNVAPSWRTIIRTL